MKAGRPRKPAHEQAVAIEAATRRALRFGDQVGASGLLAVARCLDPTGEGGGGRWRAGGKGQGARQGRCGGTEGRKGVMEGRVVKAVRAGGRRRRVRALAVAKRGWG